MNSDLELLLQLQVIDYDIGELERSKEYLPDMIENLNREIEDTRQKLEETKSGIEESRVRQKTLELEIATKEADLQKYQQQMMSIKTNKEYDALVSQIDAIKEELSTNESEMLNVMEVGETLAKEMNELEEKCVQVEENNKKQLVILQERIDSIGEKMVAKESSRAGVIASIPRPTLSVYERVRKGKGGRAVVAVKRRACGSCYKALTPKKIQEVKRATKVDTCDHCGAIIYWDEAVSD